MFSATISIKWMKINIYNTKQKNLFFEKIIIFCLFYRMKQKNTAYTSSMFKLLWKLEQQNITT